MSQDRAVSVIRLSVLTDATTSPDRQRAANTIAMAHFGMRQVGVAEDLDVSATKTTPWERPELAAWLAAPDTFDALVWWRIDRAIRSMTDMSNLVSWAKQHGKRLVFAEGPGGGPMELDLSGNSPVAELLVMVFAFAAQMEALAISDRVAGAHAAIRNTELRWAGGIPPYGYQAVKRETGSGWTLIPDDYKIGVLRYAVKLLKEGLSRESVCVRLYEEGMGRWYSGTLRDVLRSQTLIGYKVTGVRKGQVPVRDENGRPVRCTDTPAFTHAEFAEIQEVLDRASRGMVKRSDTNSLAFGALFCTGCGWKLYYNRGGEYKKGRRPNMYSCRVFSRGVRCPSSVSIKAEWADEWIEREFLKRVGSAPMRETVYHPGSDPRPEIERTAAELDTVASHLSAAQSDAERDVWERRVKGLSSRLAELEALPVTEPWTETVPTSRTVAEAWADADTAERRAMLLEAGVRVEVRQRPSRGGPTTKEAAMDRLSMELQDPNWAAVEDAMEDAEFQSE